MVIVGVIGFVGYILFMVGMHRLAQYYPEPAIFKNLLNALIIGIISTVVLGVALLVLLIATAGGITPTATPTTIAPALQSFFIVLGGASSAS